MANLRANRITSTEVFETTGSVQFDGSGDYLSLANSTDFDFGSGNFTIEFWIYTFSGGTKGIISKRTTGGASNTNWAVYINANQLQLYVSDGTNYIINGISGGTIGGDGNWHHCAIVRNGNIFSLYVDGVSVASQISSGTIASTSRPVYIGVDHPGNSTDISGHISNLRVLKGQALYTTNFTPPTRELEVIPNTVLLACQSTTKADEEKTGKTITVNGNAVANELTPGLLTSVVKSGGSSAITGSVEFDGTGDYLSIPNTSDFDFGSGEFTIEFWINTTTTTLNGIASKRTSGGASNTNWLVYVTAAGALQFYASDGSTYQINGISGGIINDGSWHHCAIVRSWDTFTLYVNGVSVTSQTTSFTISSTSRPFYIGVDHPGNSTDISGFISNLRIIKGTALYTSNFIPPTRKLTKLPGTVLLCCQDSNDPTTEATGKTITGYGDLQKADGVELVTNGDFSNTNASSVTSWDDISVGTGTISEGSGYASLNRVDGNNSGRIGQGMNLVTGKVYTVSFDLVSGSTSGVQLRQYNSSTQDISTVIVNFLIADGVGKKSHTFTSQSGYDGLMLIPIDNTSTVARVDNFSVTLAETRNGASDFTPSVGSDGSVEFAGPTTINTENYFYLPTGNTESRTLNVATQASSSARGVFMGGLDSAPTTAERDVIDYITIASSGNAVDFGNLTAARRLGGACSSATRGISLGGFNSPVVKNEIEYITISSTGDAKDFGDLIATTRSNGGLANSTRGISFGGVTPSPAVNTINYITIASTGNAQDFGDLVSGSAQLYGTASPTRGVIGGGETPSLTNTIQYVTIATMGNALDFGDLSAPRSGIVAFSNSTRGCFAGGEESPGFVNTIDYVTISTTANSLNFGDLNNTNGLRLGGSASSPTRGIYASGGNNTPVSNTSLPLIHMVTINSTGDSIDFGDITVARYQIMNGTVSSGHGGLG